MKIENKKTRRLTIDEWRKDSGLDYLISWWEQQGPKNLATTGQLWVDSVTHVVQNKQSHLA